jgi:hypothetical protein
LIGLVISNKNLLCAQWTRVADKIVLSNVANVKLDNPLFPILSDEKELNKVLSNHLKDINDSISLAGDEITISIDDDLLTHGVINNEIDLSREDHLDFINWKVNSDKSQPKKSIYCQSYLPDEPNLHYVTIPTHLAINLKLTLSGLGCQPLWMGPISSTILDWGDLPESTWVHKSDKGFHFFGLIHQQFHFGYLAFSKGNIVVKNSTAKSDQLSNILSLSTNSNKRPIISTGSLTPKMKKVWKNNSLMELKPFEGIDYEDIPNNLPSFESIILSVMAKSKSHVHSMNFFNEPGITDFPLIDKYYDVPSDDNVKNATKGKRTISKIKKPVKTESNNVLYYLLMIGILFLGMNYLKYRSDINNPIWPFNFINTDIIFKVDRSSPKTVEQLVKKSNTLPQELINKSFLISKALNDILLNSDINKYSTLTITKNFISLEYRSIVDPEFGKYLPGDLVSYSEEKETESSNITRYYSFDMPKGSAILNARTGLTPEDVIAQLDSSLTGYSLKYFDQIYKDTHIFEPLLIRVKSIDEITTVSRILNEAGNRVLFRKFVLFNNPSDPNPKAGYYISFLNPK